MLYTVGNVYPWGEGWIGGAQKIFRAVKTLYVTCKHGPEHLSKPIGCKSLHQE